MPKTRDERSENGEGDGGGGGDSGGRIDGDSSSGSDSGDNDSNFGGITSRLAEMATFVIVHDDDEKGNAFAPCFPAHSGMMALVVAQAVKPLMVTAFVTVVELVTAV